jgi:hypothetical protein
MDVISAAVMVLLSCTPDLMLCRQSAAFAFSSLSECRQALTERRAQPGRDGRGMMVGRCEAREYTSGIPRWGVSPNGELFYAAPQDVMSIAEVSESGAPRKVERGPATVKVTRGNGSGASTTSTYTVFGTVSN